MRFIFVLLSILSRFDCRPSAEHPVARRPSLGDLGCLITPDRPSSPQSARRRKREKKKMIPDFDPPPLRVRCLSLSYTQNKKINVAKCGITEASNTSLSLSRTDGLLPAAAAAHALRVRVQMATPTAPISLITHQSFGWSGYHDCILGPGVVPEALPLSVSLGGG